MIKRWLFWKLTLAPNWLQDKYSPCLMNWIHRHMIMCEQDWDYDPSGGS